MISASIIKDSISTEGYRITTFVLTYPRFIHAEFMTHRVFSRNAASSRAIPIKKMLDRAKENPAVPVYWGKNKAGMQAAEELAGWKLKAATFVWFALMHINILGVKILSKLNVHKQIANRPIEPWFNIQVVVTATEFENFFNLRLDKNAQPEIRELAMRMFEAYTLSAPEVLLDGEWHLPFVSKEEIKKHNIHALKKMSVARCARVSYLNHDRTNPSPEKDYETHDRLLKDGHVSPFEHQATPMIDPEWSGNFFGWKQYRKTLPGENRSSLSEEYVSLAQKIRSEHVDPLDSESKTKA